MKSIYVGVMSVGTQHTNEQARCSDYSFVHSIPSDTKLRNIPKILLILTPINNLFS